MSERHDDDADGGYASRRQPLTDEAFSQLADALRGLRYGVVSIIVQDGVIVQIERTEKRRLRKPENS
jgi:hypothetical protein